MTTSANPLVDQAAPSDDLSKYLVPKQGPPTAGRGGTPVTQTTTGGRGAPQTAPHDDLSKYLVPKAEHNPAAEPGAIQREPGGPIYNIRTNPPPRRLPVPSAGESGRALQVMPGGGYMFTDAPVGEEKKMERANFEGSQTGGQIGATALAAPAAIEAPLATAAGLGGAYVGGRLSRYGAKKAGAGEDIQDLAEALGGLVGGVGGAKVGGMASEAAGKFWNTPERAGKIYERAVAPNGQSAQEQEAMRETFQRAAKHIAPETRAVDIPKGEGGVMRAADVVNQAGNRLWEQRIQPVVDVYKARVDDVSSVAKDIRDSFTDLDKTTNPGKVAAGENLAKSFDRKMTVGEMADQVKQLNNDKSVSRYYQMSDIERTQAELADPSLRSKVTALNSLRGKLIESVTKFGGDEVGKGFAEDRKDWGALRTVQGQLENARVPTPEGHAARALNSTRALLRPVTYGTRQGILDLNNPNKLAPRSLNMLGKTDLAPSPAAPLTVPGTPQNPVTDADFVMSGPKVEGVNQGRYSGPEPPPVPAKGTELPTADRKLLSERGELPPQGGSSAAIPVGPSTTGTPIEPINSAQPGTPGSEPPAGKIAVDQAPPKGGAPPAGSAESADRAEMKRLENVEREATDKLSRTRSLVQKKALIQQAREASNARKTLAKKYEPMVQEHPRAGGQGQSTEDLPPLHPDEHAELEKQAGRKLTTEDAAKFRNGQLIEETNRKMAATGEGTKDEVANAREPNREELDRKAAATTEPALPGMEKAVEEQKTAAAAKKGEDLTAESKRPLGNIEAKAGEMERSSEAKPAFHFEKDPKTGRMIRKPIQF